MKKNPPCICLDVFTEAAFGGVDRSAWIVEYEHYVLDGHVASCHHRSTPAKGMMTPDYSRQHRIFARILHDMITTPEGQP